MRKEVKIGNLGVGGKNPVRIKGMLKTPSREEKKLVKEAYQLYEEGAEALRVAFQNERDKKVALVLKKEVPLPLVADIHFNWKSALSAIETGVDGIRLNPANIIRRNQIKQIVKEAKEAGISIRIGVNSGGFRKKFSNSLVLARNMVRLVADYIKIFETMGFFDIIVSLKASDVYTTWQANKLFSEKFSYPLHLGITASGPFLDGVVKSSLGIGLLLREGIGDIIRVSLTAPAREEIKVAKAILQFLGIRYFFPEIVSCPTCGRCKVDLKKIVNTFQKKIEKESFRWRLESGEAKKLLPPKIAIMGCVVNGPGEAAQADLGIAFGKKRGAIFQKGEIVGVKKDTLAVKELWEMVKDVI